jgi:hypothetical protein
MRLNRQSGKASGQAGSALLIAIFALLLISVVGIALLVSTGSDTSLAGNYRTSAAAYYAAVAGLEEARGRLLRRNPDFLNKSNSYSALFNGQGTSFGLTDVLYIINPANGETVNPTDTSSSYGDKEYGTEFSWQLGGANVYAPVNSVSPVAGIPGPAFKWVRINAVTEAALTLDVDNSGSLDSTTPLFYNGSGLNLTSSGSQALEITALAVMPDNSRRLLQYLVVPNTLQSILAPGSLQLSQAFPSALTLAGNGVSYGGPTSNGFYVNGNDPTTGRSCATLPFAPLPAIGFTNSADQSAVVNGTNPNGSNYTGATPPPPAPATPSVGQVSLPSSLQTPSQLESLITTITQGADVVIQGSASATSVMPSTMSPMNPMTIVVNGDLDFNAWHNTGYGLLLVTGNLNYDPDASWVGVILVIGQGTITGSRSGNGRLDGTILVAQTRNAAGAVLPDPNLGASSVSFRNNMGGVGIYYDSCAIFQALAPTKYAVLSFREIAQ